MALFRFYDTRILLAFLGILHATDAAAVLGPADRIYALKAGVPSVVTRPTLSGPVRMTAPPEQPYAVNAHQMDVMGKITDHTFRARLADYLATEFPQNLNGRSTSDLQEIIAQSINDCPRLEVCREMDIVILSIARLRIPETVASDSFWNAVIEQRPNPNQRAGAFLTDMLDGMSRESSIAFYQKVNGWWQFGK